MNHRVLTLLFTLPLLLSFGKSSEENPFLLGSEMLFTPDYYPLIEGKSLGFFGNQTSLETLNRLIDDPHVDIRRIFVPEHGLLGVIEAGEEVSDGLYRGIPVISAYGYGARKIDPQRLEDLDGLIFEIQDIGNRHYTYISSMYLQMDSCADAGIPILILDRPNAAGDLVEGPIMEPSRQSYIGLFGPVAHGMTLGELAQFYRDEPYWLQGDRYPRLNPDDPFHNVSQVELTVVPMENYQRELGFYQPGRSQEDWIPTSPNIPSPESAICYKGNGLLDGHEIKEIVSSYQANEVEQFVAIELPQIEMREELEAFLEGCRQIYPFPGVNLVARRNQVKDLWNIVEFQVYDPQEYHSTLAVLALVYLWEQQRHPGEDHGFNNRDHFNKAMGNQWISQILVNTEEYSFKDIQHMLEIDESLFREAREPYLLY